jgi:glycosyltransferase involved in cell wall biosynthesis
MESPTNNNQRPVVICMPIYNDWVAAVSLLKPIDDVSGRERLMVTVLWVDDGSREPPPEGLPERYQNLESIRILRLRTNVGHQRAIALGLAYIYEHIPCSAVIVMDGDGQDSPEDIAKLLQRSRDNGGSSLVFAKRARRSESIVFRLFYRSYRLLHRLLTGLPVEVGNFSIVPSPFLERLVGLSELWNHYAAAVVKSKIPMEKVDIPRASRIQGETKMNFVGLVTHGLSAMAVFGEDIGVRLLSAATILIGFVAIALALVVSIPLFTDMSIPGWATAASGVLAIILLNCLLLSMVFIFIVLQGRSRGSFLPLRDYQYYIMDVTTFPPP